MAKLIHFLSDMMGSQASQRHVQERFVEKPDEVMANYGLSDEQKEAIRKGRYDEVGQHVAKELQVAAQGSKKPDTNW
jgi:predicted ribosome quality control (RQC) complex YloA/Tae2 family protein